MKARDVGQRGGRPKAEDAPVVTADILTAAMRAFARHGYDGVSVRTLNRELGVSHNLIHQRFGTKEGLWRAAVDHAFGGLVNEVATGFDPTVGDPLAQLNLAIRRFLHFSARHPELLALMNAEAGLDTDRLRYIYDTYVEPALAPLAPLLEYLAAEGVIRPVPLRTLNFLIAHGAGAPFTLTPFARLFGGPDPLDPTEVERHSALTADIITSGLAL
ncbi:TetR/AcrR family transcriptional regulator [Nocardioides sp.]|uniref:TetR/AcrR family transcriptional regulator n=1 Tax=Nocardioides sp. TaxID=35761 RepID=UPI0031FF1C0D|nr:transcriptional regulator, TetR family [Nocardioides sp.]